MRKVIFLDIDGVLNNIPFLKKTRNPFAFDPKSVKLLRETVMRHQVEIVITSTWRLFQNWQELVLKAFREAGWNNPPLKDKTPVIEHGSRGEEIQAWLSVNPVQAFAIVDDDDDILPEHQPRFVQTSIERGLTRKEADEISSLLTV